MLLHSEAQGMPLDERICLLYGIDCHMRNLGLCTNIYVAACILLCPNYLEVSKAYYF